MDILIKGATIVSQNENRALLKDQDILLEGNRIAEIGKGLKSKAEITVDGRGKLAFPGLINAHTHVAMTLFRGYGEGMLLNDWLTKKIWPAEAKLKRKHVKAGALLGIAEMIRGGTTAFNEMYVTGLDGIADAAEKAGVRATIAYGCIDDVPGRETEKELNSCSDFIATLDSPSKRIRPAVACHAPYTCTQEALIKAKELARKKDLGFHIHASENRREVFEILDRQGKRPIEYLDALGILDKRTLLAHAVFVTKREIGIVGKAGASVAHCPVSNMKLAGGGVCPFGEFAQAGANVTIGTDGAASNNSLNMLESMKLTALGQKNFYWDPLAISDGLVLDAGTRNGAAALGIDCGVLAPGKLADFVLADMGMANMAPCHDPITNIIYAMHPGNITHVIVDGKVILDDREITTFDEQKAIDDAKEAAEDLVGSK